MSKNRFVNYNKYSNKNCTCNLGHIHDSRAEARYCDELTLRLKAGEIEEVRYQVKYDLKANGEHVTNHIVDFVVTFPDGNIEVHEYKGFATEVWKLKMKLFEANFPTIPYIVVRGTHKK